MAVLNRDYVIDMRKNNPLCADGTCDARRTVKRLSIICLFLLLLWLFKDGILSWINMSRYGVDVQWSFGATSTYPTADITVRWHSEKVECPYFLGGIRKPSLKFLDIDDDGHLEFVLANREKQIIVRFIPGTENFKPKFSLVRDDTKLNDNGNQGVRTEDIGNK